MMKESLHIREVEDRDAPAIARIYNEYIHHSVATFEEQGLTDGQMLDRIQEIRKSFPYLIAESGSRLIGYAYANHWKTRSAYRYSAESSIYLDPGLQGLGYGKLLYGRLIQECMKSGLHMLIGGISLPNDASVKLHESLGFKHLGTFHRVGRKFDRWIDVGYWELHL